MATKFPELICKRYVYFFSEGWEAIWHPQDPSKPRGAFTVTINHHHEKGGDSISYSYSGPPSVRSSRHLIKRAIKEKALPKSELNHQ